MNYKLCELYNKYTILLKYEQNTHFIQIASCLHLKGNIADDAMQMDVHKTLYPFYTRKKMPHVTVTITKNTSLAERARYIIITTVYTVDYLHIFNAGHFFSSKHCHDLQRKNHWIAVVFNETRNYDFILLSKQGCTQLIYSTEHVFENFRGNCPVDPS